MQKLKNFLVPAASIVVVLILIGSAYYYFKVNGVISAKVAGDRAINYVNQSIASQGGTATATLGSVIKEKDVYKINFNVGTNSYTVYVSKDGKYFFPAGYDLASTTAATQGEDNQTSSEIVKSDKPDLKLFVMSYCPYGLQAEKMYLPVYNLLKDKADMGIYFVSYMMHGEQEMNENLRQYCIQRDEKVKYYNYLSCFVKSGKYEDCLAEVKIDSSKLSACETEIDNQYKITSQFKDQSTWLSGKYPKFDVNADLNTQYGVQGSPTVILNGKEVSVNPRSPEVLKQAICAAFNSAPAECSETLSATSASTGFGEAAGAATSGGSCE
jgi:hypothetical protein